MGIPAISPTWLSRADTQLGNHWPASNCFLLLLDHWPWKADHGGWSHPLPHPLSWGWTTLSFSQVADSTDFTHCPPPQPTSALVLDHQELLLRAMVKAQWQVTWSKAGLFSPPQLYEATMWGHWYHSTGACIPYSWHSQSSQQHLQDCLAEKEGVLAMVESSRDHE